MAMALVAGPPSRAQAPEAASGGFGGTVIPSPPVESTLVARSARAWAWNEGPVNRLLLERDVSIHIGGHRFIADRAAIWIEPFAGERQVAIYLDNARDPKGDSAITQRADRLLITARLRGPAPSLSADLFETARPAPSDFLAAANLRLARYLATLRTGDASPPPLDGPADQRPSAGADPLWARIRIPDDLAPPEATRLPPADREPVRTAGVFSFSSGDTVRRVLDDNAGTDAIIADGGIVVQYESTELRTVVELKAQRGVVFLASPDANPVALSTVDVAGVYLEGDVQVTTPDYSMRATRVFVDVQSERAILLDAVFWTFDADKGMPLYLRADEVRQESALQWSGENVRLSNVAFAEPHFSIGIESLTLSGRPSGNAPAGIGGVGAMEGIEVEAKGLTFRAADLPLASIGRASGDIRPSPLRRIDIGSKDGEGVVRTEWDLYTILGLDAAPGNDATLLVDGYLDRGPALGTDLSWRSGDLDGALFAYYIHDDGTDHLTSGAEIEQDDQDRYLIMGEQTWKLTEQWSLFIDLALISDETFVDAFFEDDAETRREFSSAIWARRLEEQEAVFIEARAAFNDFVSAEYLFQSLGYHTQRFPELSAYTVGRTFFDDLLTYFGEARAGVLDLRFSDPSLRKLGFDTLSRANAAAGLTPDDSLADVLSAAGVPNDQIARFDTRHEIEVPLSSGPVNLVPFAVGRFTAYDTDFDEYGDADDNWRAWGSVGVRAGTTFIRVDDGARSDLFDLDGIRHIVEPQVTAWTAGTTVEQGDLPIFDDDVESLADGSTVRVGLRNTFQTRRGPDRRSVDWIVLDTDLVWASGDIEEESPFFTFIDSRPENGSLGEFFDLRGAMRLTDGLSLVGGHQIGLDSGDATQSSIGFELDHGASFRSYAEFRERDPIDQRTLNAGAAWEFTLKHALGIDVRYDLDESELQDVGIAYTRRFLQWTVQTGFSFDGIGDDVSLGISFRPVGFSGETRIRDFRSNASVFAEPIADTPRPGEDRGRRIR